MSDKDDGGAFGVKFGDNIHEETSVDWVEALGGLVENKQLGIVHDSDAELDFLLHAGAELVDFLVSDVW